jgi:hypothetical protein
MAWGVVSQNQGPANQSDSFKVHEGELAVNKILIKTPLAKADVKVFKGSETVAVKQVKFDKGSLEIEFKEAVKIRSEETLQLEIKSL